MKILPTLVLLSLLTPLYAASPVWRVNGESTSLYLAGTVHILRERDYPLPATFNHAYARSQLLVFEVDIEETQSDSFRQTMAQAIRLPAGKQLQDVLQTSTMDKLQAYLQQKGMHLKMFEGLKPAMIATTLTMLELKNIGVNSTGVDAHFYHKARKDEKDIMALETAQQQVQYLSQMGKGNEDMMILQTLKEIQSLETDFTDMLNSWKQGDADRLEALFIDPMKQEFAPIYQQLLVERNIRWMDRLRYYLTTTDTELVLVGTAHMIGEDGLLKLLADEGYTITQLQ